MTQARERLTTQGCACARVDAYGRTARPRIETTCTVTIAYHRRGRRHTRRPVYIDKTLIVCPECRTRVYVTTGGGQ